MTESAQRIARLLRLASLSVLGFATIVTGWLIVQAWLHPATHARQFGKYGPSVPLWLPLIVFIAFGLCFIAYVFYRAARRVQGGEDLYAHRHRRRPGRSHAP